MASERPPDGLLMCQNSILMVSSWPPPSLFPPQSDSLRIAWWAVSISSTIFALAWDFRMDWVSRAERRGVLCTRHGSATAVLLGCCCCC